ncbi:MAG TPA: hypothetical protein VF141_00930, partial [Chryseolinea sp.]
FLASLQNFGEKRAPDEKIKRKKHSKRSIRINTDAVGVQSLISTYSFLTFICVDQTQKTL